MVRFSAAFSINKNQSELDFVDVPLNTDIPLFVDPYAFHSSVGSIYKEGSDCIRSFFNAVVDAIRDGDNRLARSLLNSLSEPNETHLGLSIGKSRGRGVSGVQADQLFNSLMKSEAVKSGMLADLGELELMVDGIGHDKISDITTNITRAVLIKYTQIQCDLYDIKMFRVASGTFWCRDELKWKQDYVDLPVFEEEKIILVPKMVVRWNMSVNHQEYYNHFVLNFLQQQHINAGSSLVKFLADGTPRVTKKDVKKSTPLSKEFLFEFSKKYPEVLESYRQDLKHAKPVANEEIIERFGEEFDETLFAKALSRKLPEIKLGAKEASNYHDYMIGVLTFLFSPFLSAPTKERPLHDGRKRVDISFTNSATSGFFFRCLKSAALNALEIAVECKNYTSDPANPELDQLSGRFSPLRGKIGILVARQCCNKDLFIQRCRDTARDQRGVIIPFFDDDLIELLNYVANAERNLIDSFIEGRYRFISS